MSNVEIGIAGIVVTLVLIAIRVPIGVALGSVSIVGVAFLTNGHVALGLISVTPFDFVGQWALTAAPMFLLMGYICTTTKLSSGLFEAMRVFLARLPGGLAVASVAGCAFFAAASGSSTATAAAMSRISVPEMLKYDYDKGLAAGSIASAGTLGSLIPPSVLLILYGVFAQVSVGQLFMAGFIPGILSALLYMAMIIVRVKIKPSLAGAVQTRATAAERRAALRNIWPLPVLIISVLGGIFSGIFSPTEAGALGAAISLVIAYFRGTLTWSAVKEAHVSAAISTVSIFIILIGSVFFTKFLALSGVPAAFADAILSVSDSRLWIIFAVTVLYFVLGMLIGPIGILLLTLPIVLPLVHSAGLDLVWFGILVVKLLEIGLVTPPVGLNVYMVKGSLGDLVSLQEIFKGIGWFVAMDLIAVVLFVAFPSIVLFLPNLLIN